MPTLNAYLHRIGFRGTPRPDLETLRALHVAHLRAIPYENLDVQLERPVSLDIGPVFDKLVSARRGGWCYEMNGLLAWALETIGFRITRLAAGVMRAVQGDEVVGNHLAIWVHLEESWLADVGFGDGTLEPVALCPGPFRQAGFEFALESLVDGWWRLHNHPEGGAPSFDFQLLPAERETLERQCRFLQTSPASPFTRVAVVQRHLPDGLAALRGRVLKRVSGRQVTRHEVADQAEYLALLRDVFDLKPPQPEQLWQRVAAQHADYLAQVTGRSH